MTGNRIMPVQPAGVLLALLLGLGLSLTACQGPPQAKPPPTGITGPSGGADEYLRKEGIRPAVP